MYRKRKNKKQNYIVIAVICLALFLVVIGASMFRSHNLGMIESALKDAGTFTIKIVNAPIYFVKEKIKDHKTKKQLLKENKKLKKKIDQIDYNEAKIDELSKEVEKLQKELELKTILGEKEVLHATVINRTLDEYYQTLNIDKGKKNKVIKGMAVINNKGLIGIISAVGNYSSTVKLLTSDTFNQISVRIKVNDNYIYGLLTGYKKSNNVFILEGISDNVEIPKNAIVTTTGMGKTFPAGLLVGRIKKVITDNFDLAKMVEVTPAANFDDLDYIAIVKRGENYDR